MEYNGKELKPITEVVAFKEPKSMLVWSEAMTKPAIRNVSAVIKGVYKLKVICTDFDIYGFCAEIPQYNKAKFKIPHNKATYKEVSEASEMTDEEFRGFLKIGEGCSGFNPSYGFGNTTKRCKNLNDCRECGIYFENSKETIEAWVKGEDIWKPKMRDRTREELLYFLWKKNKSECVVARYSAVEYSEYRHYSNHMYSIVCLSEYTFATMDETGKITEFEIPQVEDK